MGASLAFAIAASALAVPITLGLYWKRMTRAAAYTCLIIPPIVFLIPVLIYGRQLEGYPLFVPPIALAILVALLLAFVVSLFTKRAPEESTRPFWEWGGG